MKLLSAKEVAKLLGINQTTVRVNAGKGAYPFRSLRVGALWKFPEEDVMKFLYGEDWKPTDEDRTSD
jgi:excisionase family DNA binding protein